jgi:hypothetical protein
MDWTTVLVCAGLVAVVVLVVVTSVIRLRLWSRKLFADARSGRPLPKTTYEKAGEGVISITDDGFTVRRREKLLAAVAWDDVDEIRAYKVDLFAVDLICWGFHRTGDDFLVEVNEHMVGFEALQEAARVRYGIALADWWEQVAFPAFATNMTAIWSKERGTS